MTYTSIVISKLTSRTREVFNGTYPTRRDQPQGCRTSLPGEAITQIHLMSRCKSKVRHLPIKQKIKPYLAPRPLPFQRPPSLKFFKWLLKYCLPLIFCYVYKYKGKRSHQKKKHFEKIAKPLLPIQKSKNLLLPFFFQDGRTLNILFYLAYIIVFSF